MMLLCLNCWFVASQCISRVTIPRIATPEVLKKEAADLRESSWYHLKTINHRFLGDGTNKRLHSPLWKTPGVRVLNQKWNQGMFRGTAYLADLICTQHRTHWPHHHKRGRKRRVSAARPEPPVLIKSTKGARAQEDAGNESAAPVCLKVLTSPHGKILAPFANARVTVLSPKLLWLVVAMFCESNQLFFLGFGALCIGKAGPVTAYKSRTPEQAHGAEIQRHFAAVIVGVNVDSGSRCSIASCQRSK